MTLRCRKNISSQISTGGVTVERYMGMGKCLESPGLKEVVISFFPGASSPHNVNVHHFYKDKPRPEEGRYKSHFLMWFLLGILLIAIWFLVSSRSGQLFTTLKENRGQSEPTPVTFTKGVKTESVNENSNSDPTTTTPESGFMGATITPNGELLMSHLEKELRITFSFDDDTETFLESVDLF